MTGRPNDLVEATVLVPRHLLPSLYEFAAEANANYCGGSDSGGGLSGAWYDAAPVLLRNLPPVSRALLEHAVRSGGEIVRDDVMRIIVGDADADRSLRGVTRPFTRIMQRLVSDGVVDASAPRPVYPVFAGPAPGVMTSLRVDPDITASLSKLLEGDGA